MIHIYPVENEKKSTLESLGEIQSTLEPEIVEEVISSFIKDLRSKFISNKLASTFEEINCGLCVDFAEIIESRFMGEVLSNDHFILEREDSEGWNGDEHDLWDAKCLTQYSSYPPVSYSVMEVLL
jgi:hypothetical protein